MSLNVHYVKYYHFTFIQYSQHLWCKMKSISLACDRQSTQAITISIERYRMMCNLLIKYYQIYFIVILSVCKWPISVITMKYNFFQWFKVNAQNTCSYNALTSRQLTYDKTNDKNGQYTPENSHAIIIQFVHCEPIYHKWNYLYLDLAMDAESLVVLHPCSDHLCLLLYNLADQ